MGLEALSRGASRAVFVDQSPEAVRLIKANIVLCRVQDRAEVLLGAMEQVTRRLAAGRATLRSRSFWILRTARGMFKRPWAIWRSCVPVALW